MRQSLDCRMLVICPHCNSRLLILPQTPGYPAKQASRSKEIQSASSGKPQPAREAESSQSQPGKYSWPALSRKWCPYQFPRKFLHGEAVRYTLDICNGQGRGNNLIPKTFKWCLRPHPALARPPEIAAEDGSRPLGAKALQRECASGCPPCRGVRPVVFQIDA